MKRRLARCFQGVGTTDRRANVPVYYVVPEMYACELQSCLACGEVFVVDRENPAFAGRALAEVLQLAACPTCGALLRDTVRPYPESFRDADGSIGSCVPERLIPPDDQSLLREFYEIEPG